MASIKLFLFDLDGTLVSTGGAGLKALDRTFDDIYGIKNVMSTVAPHGKTDPAIFREIFKVHLKRDMLKDDLTLVGHAYLRYLAVELRYTKTYKILPGVQNFLDLLMTRGDILIGLGTGNLEQGARLKLVRSNLNPYFPFGGFGSDAEWRVDVLKMGHRRAEERCHAKIKPEAVFVIGDTKLDVEAAHLAGFRSVAVSHGSSDREELAAAGPEFILDDLTQGFKFLKQIDQVFGRVAI